ncbi:MAG TPA: hypothetical protein PK317_01170 [Coprothermobacter proteolyticus]|nr:hypothetical protein [Coprothermobacter proteolyticus]
MSPLYITEDIKVLNAQYFIKHIDTTRDSYNGKMAMMRFPKRYG